MNSNGLHAVVVAMGMAACFLFNGCAHEKSREAVYQPIEPTQRTPQSPFVVTGTNVPLNNQWYFTNSNQPSATSSGEASGSEPLHYEWRIHTNRNSAQFAAPSNPTPVYQWYKSTNSNDGQSFTVEGTGGTNGPLYYQWYRNTNTNEGN